MYGLKNGPQCFEFFTRAQSRCTAWEAQVQDAVLEYLLTVREPTGYDGRRILTRNVDQGGLSSD